MHKYKYDVALSFASEQRDYVEQVVAELSVLGTKVFYDNNLQVDLWGKNLIRYLEKIYFEESYYCVMFISKEYKHKYWTRYESEILEERNFFQNEDLNFQHRILPVRFDDTKIPGIRSTLGYISAQEISPKALAQMIYQKIHKIDTDTCEAFRSLNLDAIYDELINRLPKNFVTHNIKKSSFDKKTDAILFFDPDHCFQNNFSCCDGKLFIDNNQKLLFLNQGYLKKADILFEITLQELVEMLLSKAKMQNDRREMETL